MKGAGCLAALLLGGIIVWAFSSGNDSSTDRTAAHWETLSGTQQGVFLKTDIDANSIERTGDGGSATVIVKLEPGDAPQRITYICRAPETGLPGAVIFDGQVTDLPAGSTSDAIMRRVCFGPLPDSR